MARAAKPQLEPRKTRKARMFVIPEAAQRLSGTQQLKPIRHSAFVEI
jgi:hypothetical protein